MARDNLTGDWDIVLPFLENMSEANLNRRIMVMMRKEAIILRGLIVRQMMTRNNGSWKKLSPWTIAFRKEEGFGGRKALLKTGFLRQAITYQIHKEIMTAFVGVLATTQNKDNQKMVNIAKVQEFGATFAVTRTPKQRKYLMYIARKYKIPMGASSGSGGTGIITIPARPFMVPAFEEWRPKFQKRMAKFLEEYQ